MTNQELNELVARKLGWTFCEHGGASGAVRPNPIKPHFHEAVPDYCHSIEAAWEIINQFHEVTLGTILTEGPCWFCEIIPQVGERVKVIADTAPRAICEAFLKLP